MLRPLSDSSRRMTLRSLRWSTTVGSELNRLEAAPQAVPREDAAAGPLSYDVSRDSHRDGAEEVTLADLDATVPENVVGGGQVKVEVRQCEVVEVVDTSHVPLVARAKRESDFTFGSRVDALRVERLYEIDRFCNAIPEFSDRLRIALESWRLETGEPRAAVLGLVASALHLLRECMLGKRRVLRSTAGSMPVALE
jgi:hypothetical protein